MRSPPAFLVLLASLIVHLAAAGLLWRSGHAAAAPRPIPLPEPSASSSLMGDSFEVPDEIAQGDPATPTDIAPPSDTPAAPATTTKATATPAPTFAPTAAPTASATTTASASARPSSSSIASASANGAAPPVLFGAVGVRYAVDLLKTFTQSLPQAASADPQWGSVALGSAGDADFTLEIDDAGELRREIDLRGAPSAALKSGILRTMGLIGGRAFTAHGARTHLRITAAITADTHEDEYHGSRFALTGTGACTGNVCTAFFALPIGRRIDFTLRVVP